MVEDISATNRAAGANADDSVDPSSAETSVAARDKCDAVSLPFRQTSQQLSAAAAGVAADVEVIPVAAAADIDEVYSP